LFDQTAFEQKHDYVTALIKLGEEVLTREEELNEIVNLDYERIVYVGTGSLAGLTREAQFKILELTAGKVATIFDSSMCF
ncbi:tagatose-6-phosphate ketose isomerase, partial [Enterococcus faecalis]